MRAATKILIFLIVAGAMWTGSGMIQAADFTSWNYKMQVSFSGYEKSGSLADFPALVVLSTGLTDFAYDDFDSPSDGADLRFTDSTETNEINYEIEDWDTNGESFVWVQVPSLSSNASIWVFWGRSGQSAPAYTTNGATWSNGFAGVWHLAETNITDETTGGTHSDSTANNNDGTQQSNSAAAGVVSGGQLFDGSSDSIDCGNDTSLQITSDMTLSLWINVVSFASERGLLSKWGSSYNWVLQTSTGVPHTYFGVGWTSSASAVSTGQWSHVAVVFDDSADTVAYYLNGQSQATPANTGNPGTGGNLFFGQNGSGGSWFDGRMDEGRMSSVTRSSDWIWAEHQNMASNSVFNSYGSVLFVNETGTIYEF